MTSVLVETSSGRFAASMATAQRKCVWLLFIGLLAPALLVAQEAEIESSPEPNPEAGEERSFSDIPLPDGGVVFGPALTRPGDNARSRASELSLLAPSPISTESVELAKLELELGRYQQLIDRLDQVLPLPPSPQSRQLPVVEIALLRSLAAAQQQVGNTARAIEIYLHLADNFDDFSSRVALASIYDRQGKRESAEGIYYGLIRSYNERPRLDSSELLAVGIACRELGRNNPQLFKDALKAFDLAIERGGDGAASVSARQALAELFVDKYDSAQARDALRVLREQDDPSYRTLLAAARVERFDGQPAARELAEVALGINPNSTEVLLFLASLENEEEDRVEAAEFVERALAVNPTLLEGLTLQAGLEFLAERGPAFKALEEQVLAQHSTYSDFYVELAQLAMRNRLYPEARDFARQAVELDPQSWEGWSELGLNQLRLGEIDEGRQNLERAFAGDPYNVWNKNTLDLLDTLNEYETMTTDHFVIVLHQDESELLGPIVSSIAERSYSSLRSRYGYEPPTPIRLEVYPSHEDFSVRTVGLSGLGALGVSFGPVIAMDSPAARGIGDFNWGTTLWHEVAHTFTLGLSNGKVPRWLTEGLSVYEERQGPKGWADEPPPDFFEAYADGRLLGLRAMNDGFVRPSYPNQIGLSYFQASIVAEYIDRTWGFDHIVSMLKRYGEGASTEEVFAAEFGLGLEEFDERFWGYLDERFKSTLPTFRDSRPAISEDATSEPDDDLSESPDPISLPTPGSAETAEGLEQAALERPEDFRAQLAYGQFLEREEKWEEARAILERARGLFPEYAGPGSPYHSLAAVALALGEKEAAAEALQGLVDVNEYDYDAHMELASLYEQLGRPAAEFDVLSRSVYIYPYRANVHERLASLATQVDDLEARLSFLRAVMSLRPSSRPRLYFELASTHRDLGQQEQAKMAVLSALELAPSFAQAQALLLELIDDDGVGTGDNS